MAKEATPLDDVNSDSDALSSDNPENNLSKEGLHDIAHTLANLLTAISGNLAILRHEPQIDGEIADMVDETADTVQQAAELTRRLLLHSKSDIKQATINLKEKKEPDPERQQRGRILFVDDEEPVRRSMSRLLKKLGYDCETACNRKDAITTCKQARQSSRPFDAVILDLVFSDGVHGEDIFQELIEIDPTIRVILTSGNLSEDDAVTYKKKGFAGVLPKPFGLAHLDMVLKDLPG